MNDKSVTVLLISKLYASQLVAEVIFYMSIQELGKIPVYRDDFLIGIISYSDILNFLDDEPEKNLYFHKLNYTIESLVLLNNSQGESAAEDKK